MKSEIQALPEGKFILKARGSEMTLQRCDDGWDMYVVNASVRAWNKGYAVPRHFATLADVEAKYKSWTGIAALVAAENPASSNH